MFWEKHVNNVVANPFSTARTSGIRSNSVSWFWPCSLSIWHPFAWPTKFIGHVLTLGSASQPLHVRICIMQCCWTFVRSQEKSLLPMCWYPALVSCGFIQKSPLNIAPPGHPAEDEVQVPLMVVITVMVAIAGRTTYDDHHPPSLVVSAFFTRSPHGPELFMFCVVMKRFVENFWKIVRELLKAPRWNASSSINTFNHQKSRELFPHPRLKFPEIALEDTIRLIGPHGFDFFNGGGQVVSSPSCWSVNSSGNDFPNLSTHRSPWNPSSRQRVVRTCRGGGVWERLKPEVSEIFEFLYPKEFLERELNFPLSEVGV